MAETIIKEAKAPVAKATNNAVAEKKKPQTMKDYVNVMMPEIKKALPNTITPERFTRIVLSAISNNKELQACTPQSFLASMMNSAQLGLEPNTPLGQAYLIPYKNHGTLEAQFQIGYKGLIDLAYRSGQVKTIYAEAVYENDEFEYELGLNPKLVHKPAIKDRGDVIYYYAVFKLTNGGEGFTVMSKDDIERHKNRFSKAANAGFSPWSTNYDEMAKKTVIKKVLKYAPLSTDIQSQIAQDETIKRDISADMTLVNDEVEYVDVVDEETGEVVENG
jgi:recombination protein RecT